jgi:branched-chain amino acid transport system permease protein
MDMLLIVLISGVMVGCIYTLIALGFVLIFKSSQVFNLAQGEFLLFGACIGWTFASALGLGFWLVLLFTIICCGFLGFLIERIILRRLIGEPLISIIMVTLAISLLLKGILLGVWWKAPYGYPRVAFLKPLRLGGSMVLSPQMLIGFLASIFLVIIFLLFFKYSKLGLGMRAVAGDYQVAQSLAVPVKRIYSITWAIASAVAVIGGLLLGQLLSVTPELASLGFIVLPVALLGGLDSIPGCILGGIIIGVAESLSAVYLDPFLPHSGGLRTIVPYLLMLVILIISPYGIFGSRRIERI